MLYISGCDMQLRIVTLHKPVQDNGSAKEQSSSVTR